MDKGQSGGSRGLLQGQNEGGAVRNGKGQEGGSGTRPEQHSPRPLGAPAPSSSPSADGLGLTPPQPWSVPTMSPAHGS